MFEVSLWGRVVQGNLSSERSGGAAGAPRSCRHCNKMRGSLSLGFLDHLEAPKKRKGAAQASQATLIAAKCMEISSTVAAVVEPMGLMGAQSGGAESYVNACS